MNWDDLLPHVLPEVVGCPEGLAIDHLRRAARTFCEGTHALEVVIEVPTVAGQAVYTITFPEDQEPCRVLNVNVDGRDYAVAGGTVGRRLARAHHGRVATTIGVAQISLEPVPEHDGDPILIEVATKPLITAEVCPDELGPYATDLGDGALSTLLRLSKQDWTDKATAAEKAGDFADRIAAVGLQVSKGRGRSRQAAPVTFY